MFEIVLKQKKLKRNIAKKNEKHNVNSNCGLKTRKIGFVIKAMTAC